MAISDLLLSYVDSLEANSMAESVSTNPLRNIRLEGLSGSADAFICSAITQKIDLPFLIILHDREEADYFLNDIKTILGQDSCLLFPTSYKKPYQFDETENANVLLRSEVLNLIREDRQQAKLIITYPEALTEKVVNKAALAENTFTARKGDNLDVDFLDEFLQEYNFERADFVYEPGQYAVRGGIIDVFSFADELPYRIELFGDEIDNIRRFNPQSQLSENSVDVLNIIPNVQTKLLKETRQSILDYLKEGSLIWFKDYRETLDIVEKGFDKASENFSDLISPSDGIRVSLSPEELFDNRQTFSESLKRHTLVEFGRRYYLNDPLKLDFECRPQPNFNKNFDLLAQNLRDFQDQEYSLFLISDIPAQQDRLQTIFQEIDDGLTLNPVNAALREGFIDHNLKRICYTDHQIFERYLRVKKKDRFSKKKALTLRELKTLQTGDYVVHIDHGVARFAGLDKVEVNGNQQEALRLVYRDNDLLYVSVHALHKISKYSGKEGEPPSVSKLGSQEWENKKKKVKRKVKDIAKDLIELYAKRKAAPGFSYPKDNFLQAELESSFMYEDTPDQASATEDVKSDMETEHPMDRLVCGDVGFGKTEVAIRAAFKAVNAGKQVAILVPTTILAMQHYHTFSGRLASFPISIEYINRFKSTKEINRIKKEVASGAIDIIIGTHRIANKDITFKDLGLMVIDEEQKFGVKVKERLKEMRVNVDALTLTATPIPRTLHFSLMGGRDLSIISTPPLNRRPVTTELHDYGEEVIRDAVSHELRRGGQVFFVHNRISDIEQIANTVYKLVPEAQIGIAHGQMEGKMLEKIMMKFIEGDYNVLVSTNIIESGLDIPNANTIIINRAHMFGLSDLHQMRGRVGRSNTKAYCYLLTPPSSTLTSDARKRLITLEEFSDLGDGFKVAMRDLDIRGAGNLLGSEQSGFINDMGFDMYHKILDEAVQELKETEFKNLFESELLNAEQLQKLAQDCLIETDLELLIPNDYVKNTSERLQLYTELDNIEDLEGLDRFESSVRDRFGPIPESVKDLLLSVQLKWMGMRLGFDKVGLKNGNFKGIIEEKNDAYFQSDTFGGILNFVRDFPQTSKMKEQKNRLYISIAGIDSIEKAREVMEKMEAVNV